MIFAESKRKVSIEEARKIVQAVHGFREGVGVKISVPLDVEKSTNVENWFTTCAKAFDGHSVKRPLVVGVFSNQSPEHIQHVISETGLDLIQFHGDEGWEPCSNFNVPAIRVIHVSSGETAESIKSQLAAGHAIAVLLDTQVTGSKERGGSGVAFDWKLAANVSDGRIPLIVAGGLTPSNVTQAIEAASPRCVDVSSGVETDGVKDDKKIADFVRAVKDYCLK